MPKRTDINKILVIGSGPIVIGQAAEFDYSGAQACMSLREEGYSVILINSNPATIMTDVEIADKVFIEPINLEFVSKIIRQELPDAILPTLGGQTGLNMAKELAESGILAEFNVELLGTKLKAIEEAEDREEFKLLMQRLNEPVPESTIAVNATQAIDFAKEIGYPVVVRPAYTLGGFGGGFANDEEQLKLIAKNGLDSSPVTQVLIEKSIAGYKEIEFEVMRDSINNALIVASMENFDPVGIHTGDSIVVSPVQTLADREYQMLRDVALKIIRALNIEGGVNIQMALNPLSMQYYIIEVNPRVSRSSALASKATGYPIAKMAAKIAVGLHLDEIINPVTKTTLAEFEPALDYVVAKIPRWPFDKFPNANKTLGTQMKATGEVMAIGRNMEEAFLKAIRSLEIGVIHGHEDEYLKYSNNELLNKLMPATDDRLFILFTLIRRGISIFKIHEITKIDVWFLDKLLHIVEIENELQSNKNVKILRIAKQNGFSDQVIADFWHKTPKEIREIRLKANIHPVYKMVDTVAGEFESKTPYYYATYEKENDVVVSDKKSVLVLGSGPIRIGQGVEFDYATVHCVKAIQEAGYEAIIMNSNPETVSTDFSVSDKLYFEPLTIEDVLNVIDLEKPLGVVVQFGGQTAINLAKELTDNGVNVLGTSIDDLNRAEDRKLFEELINDLNLPKPIGKTATNVNEALKIAKEIGYPVLIRPSYVLGGRAMEIVTSDSDLKDYMQRAVKVSNEHPVLIDSYLVGSEAEVDVISDGKTIVIPGILEHIERSGIHSGDSMGVYPPQNMSKSVKDQIVQASIKLAKKLNVVGLINVQFVIKDEIAYVIEVNPRASRTVPFMSKVTNIKMAQIATKAMLDIKLNDLGFNTGLVDEVKNVYVKAPIFSFNKLPLVDSTLGPEMKSTGEVMGADVTFSKALYKAFLAANITIPSHGNVMFTVANGDKKEAMMLAKRFNKLGFQIYATKNTADFFEENNIKTNKMGKLSQTEDNIVTALKEHRLQLVVNTMDNSKRTTNDGAKIRQATIENSIPLFTSLDTVSAFLKVLEEQALSLIAL